MDNRTKSSGRHRSRSQMAPATACFTLGVIFNMQLVAYAPNEVLTLGGKIPVWQLGDIHRPSSRAHTWSGALYWCGDSLSCSGRPGLWTNFDRTRVIHKHPYEPASRPPLVATHFSAWRHSMQIFIDRRAVSWIWFKHCANEWFPLKYIVWPSTQRQLTVFKQLHTSLISRNFPDLLPLRIYCFAV